MPLTYVINQLKPVDSTLSGEGESAKITPTNTQVDQKQEHYEILGILNHRMDKTKKAYEYLVRWKGYGEDDDSWIHEQDFDGAALIKRYWKQRTKGDVILPTKGRSNKKPKSRSP